MALFVFCAFFFLAVASATEQPSYVSIPRSDEHNIIDCDDVDPKDWVRLYKQTLSAKAKFLQIVEKTVTFPQSGVGVEVLTCIRIINLDQTGHGGYPDIIDGGRGFRHVTINLKSQRNYGLKFEVELWGQKPTY